MLFQNNGQSILFHLKYITEDESRELTELIKENGGEIIDDCEFFFTNPETYKGEETAFDIRYIYDCIRVGRVLIFADDYIIERGKLGSFLTKLFTAWGKRCYCSKHASPSPCEAQVFTKENRNTTLSDEHNNVTTDCANENQSRILSTEETDYTPISDSIYNPDETQSQQLIDRDKNIETQLSHEIGNTQISDSIYNPDDTQSQSIDETTNGVIEVASGSDRPNKRFSFEIIRTFETAASSNSNVEKNKDVCDIKKEPCFGTETARNNGIHIFNEIEIEISSSSETDIGDTLDKSPANIEIASGRNSESPPRDQSPKLRSSNSQRLSVTPERRKPPDSKKGKLKTGLRCKNTRKQTAASTKAGDTMDLLSNFQPTKDTTENTPRDTGNSRVISDSETDCDEVTLDKRVQRTQKKRTEFESESDSDEKYSPLIDSDFISDSDSPKSRKRKVLTSLTEKNVSEQSSDDRTAIVTSSKSDQLCDRLSSSDDDSESRRVRTWKRINLPSCSGQSQPSRSQLKTRKTLYHATRNFMPWEQKEMVKYLIKNNYISGAKGNNVWKQMISDGFLEHRTFQSLQNHFRKSILPNIHRYSMDAKSRAEFEKLQSR